MATFANSQVVTLKSQKAAYGSRLHDRYVGFGTLAWAGGLGFHQMKTHLDNGPN